MVVRDASGERLGTLVSADADTLVVAHGVLGLRRLVVPRTEVRMVREGLVELRHTAAAL